MAKDKQREQFLKEGRALILSEADAMYHALGCRNCGLRFQGLLALALVGWNEQEFVDADLQSRA